MNKKQKVYITITCLYMLLLLWNSLQAGASAGHPSTIKQVAHNLAHIPAYSLLAMLLFLSFSSEIKGTVPFTSVLAFIAASVYGAFNEYIQSFVSGRTASAVDMFLNIIGAGMAVLLLGKQKTIND